MTRHSRLLRIAGALSATIAVTYVCTAFAGLTATYPVTIDMTNRTATGSAGSARNSGDNFQYLYCGLVANTTTVEARCYAQNATQVNTFCTSLSSSIVSTIRTMSSDSYVNFKWDTSNHCTQVQVMTGSQAAPKAP